MTMDGQFLKMIKATNYFRYGPEEHLLNTVQLMTGKAIQAKVWTYTSLWMSFCPELKRMVTNIQFF